MGESEKVDPLATGLHEFNQSYAVLVWEGADTEATRLKLNQDASRTFLRLHNAVRDRFYVTANQNLGGAQLCWYAGTRFPERPGSSRWFLIGLNVAQSQGFTD